MRARKTGSALAALAVLLLTPAVSAQSDRQETDAEILRGLIDRLESRDQRVAREAAEELIDVGPPAVPLLVERLTRGRGCQFHLMAAGVVSVVEPGHPVVTPTLIKLVRGECAGRTPDDAIARRQAGLILATRADGIPVLAAMLKDRDLFISRTAAFGFDELAEALVRQSDGEASALVAPALAALPALVEALRHRDEMVRCLAFEALDEFRVADADALQADAVRRTDAVVPPPDCALPGNAPGWRRPENAR